MSFHITGANASETLMVGDSLRSDFEGSRAAGIGQQVLLDRAGLQPDVSPRIGSLTGLLDLFPE